jgi:hypothetical protein
LKNLQKAGIPPADVIYMTHGLEITASSKKQQAVLNQNFAFLMDKCYWMMLTSYVPLAVTA